MKKLHTFLKVFLFVQLGGCFGRVLAQYGDYKMHPALYEFYSAPWYTGILITAVLTAITVTLTAIAYFVVGHILKKRVGKSTETTES